MNVINLIPEGRENAIKREELSRKSGLTDREMRKQIEQARLSGVIIINLQDSKGYFRPRPNEFTELARQYKQNQNRAMSILTKQKYLRRILKEHGYI